MTAFYFLSGGLKSRTTLWKWKRLVTPWSAESVGVIGEYTLHSTRDYRCQSNIKIRGAKFCVRAAKIFLDWKFNIMDIREMLSSHARAKSNRMITSSDEIEQINETHKEFVAVLFCLFVLSFYCFANASIKRNFISFSLNVSGIS